ncbi:MAG: heavy metal-associated domain-containing protein [Microscillaceae bacterium]|nr:heavy metal-associated domain-containing protein [Microscillaceae bacterium]
MSKLQILFLSLALLTVSLAAQAQNTAAQKGLQEVQIKTSAQCDMCKMRIEEALAFTPGVKKAELNVETKVATIAYNPKKTDVQKLREAIAKVGYDADEVSSDPKAYEALPACCKKGGH